MTKKKWVFELEKFKYERKYILLVLSFKLSPLKKEAKLISVF